MTVNERIKDFYEKHLSVTPTYFARSLKLSKQAINGLTNNPGSAPSFKTIEAIATTYPDISLRWLILGEGEMLLSDESTANLQITQGNNVVANGVVHNHGVGGQLSESALRAELLHLQTLLAEKERTIKILLGRQQDLL